MKLFQSILLSIIITSSFTLIAQCPTEDQFYERQGQIDSFLINYPNCTTFDHAIHISGLNIKNLHGLRALNSIEELRIGVCDSLLSLDGLEGLTYAGVLHLSGIYNMKNVDSLCSLVTIGDALIITIIDSLENLNGLKSLTNVGGLFAIASNNNLKNLNGLKSLTSVGVLRVQDNASLNNIDGLSGLTTIESAAFVAINEMLQNLDGLSGVTSIGGDLTVESNSILNDFCGLYTVFSTPGGFEDEFIVFGNPVNPTIEEVLELGAACPVLCPDQISGINDTICSSDSIDLTRLLAGSPSENVLFGTEFGIYDTTSIVSPTTTTTYYVYDSISPGRYDTAQITITVLTEGECVMDFASINEINFSDPCLCDQLIEVQGPSGPLYYFRDTLQITALGGQTIVFSATGSSGLYNSSYLPIADMTPIPETAPGVYKLEIFKLSGETPVGFVSVNGSDPIQIDPLALETCDAFEMCPTLVIPTLGQWGLMILSLGFLIFGTVGLRYTRIELGSI